MTYQVAPMGDVWQNGSFSVPTAITDTYIKMASEYQIKSLLLLLRNNGLITSGEIAKTLGLTETDVTSIMTFWIEEGVVFTSETKKEFVLAEKTAEVPKVPKQAENKSIKTKTVEELPAPNLTPKDIVAILREDDLLKGLMQECQTVLGRTISQSEQATIINMVHYYGLAPEVVLMIFEYYRSEKEKGRAMTISYAVKMAKNWSEEGITTLDDAERKLDSISKSDRIWNEILTMLGINYRRPTENQCKTVNSWVSEISMEIIELACNETKENASNPSFNYLKKVVENWIKKGIKTKEDYEKDKDSYNSKKEAKSQKGKLENKPTYDLEDIKSRTQNNTEIKF